MRLRKNAKLELIKSIPLFSRCTKGELAAIAAVADELGVPAGKDLAVEGAAGREFVILVEGSADVRRQNRRVNQLGDGDFFGEIALLTGGPRTATVTTTAPSDILVLTHRAFKRVTETMPSVNAKIVEALAERLPRDSL
jgi:CRP/FNR family transcriptional regulator, cyclic AMP receptor protein